MKNYIQEGEKITWTNATGSAVLSGAVVIVGSVIGVATGDIANAATGTLAIEGVFELPKVAAGSAKAFTQGENLTFDVSAAVFEKGATTAATGDISGTAFAFTAATTTATTGYIKLSGKPGTITA